MKKILMLFLCPLQIFAESPLHWSIGLDTAQGWYSSRSRSRQLTTTGLWLDMDGKQGGLHFAVNKSRSIYHSGYHYSQTTQQGALRLYLPLEPPGSKFIFELDAMRTKCHLGYKPDEFVRVSGAHIGYLGGLHPGTLGIYADLGAAKSRYDNGNDVEQWVPSLGFGLNGKKDWVTLALEHIQRKHRLYPFWKQITNAYSLSWRHYFSPGTFYQPEHITLMWQGGNRFFAVNTKQGNLFNHYDARYIRAGVDASWKLPKNSHFLFGCAKSFFKDVNKPNFSHYASWAASSSLSFHF